jgi:hypothetical protein
MDEAGEEIPRTEAANSPNVEKIRGWETIG